MTPAARHPRPLPTCRIVGEVTDERRRMLALVDVVVGYVTARHRLALVGWHVEGALVESRTDFRGGETLALRATPLGGRDACDLQPVPTGVLREIASRVTTSLTGIANVVPDVASVAPDVGAEPVGPVLGEAWHDDPWPVSASWDIA